MAGITDKEARSLIAKSKREGLRLTQADGTLPGLTFVATKAGTGVWRLRYYVGPKQKEVTIGQFPAWGVADAREHAKELRRSVDKGVDVALEKQMAKVKSAGEQTIDQLSESYFDKVGTELAPHTLTQRCSIHRRFVKPVIGSFPVTAVEPKHVVETVKKSLSAGATIPRLVLVHLGQLFYHAIGSGVCQVNPCRDIREDAVVGKAAKSRLRVALSVSEFTVFLPALKSIPRPYELGIWLLLTTGVRVGTMTEAQVSEFDLSAGTWSVPHSRRKNRRYTTGPFIIPLPAEAVAWVKELIELSGGGDYLFPTWARRNSEERNKFAKTTVVADWLDRMHKESKGAWRRITPHDLRSTCKSWLSELRVDYETRQRYLDHALEGMDAIYDKSDYLEHRLAAAEKWLGFLNDVKSGKEAAKVVSIQGAA